MTKKEFVYIIITDLSGGDPSPEQLSIYHPGDIENHIETILGQSISEHWKRAKMYKDFSVLEQFCVTIEEEPLKVNGTYELELPFELYNLPECGSIRLVTAKDSSRFFVYSSPSDNIIYSSLEVGASNCFDSYNFSENKLYFPDIDVIEGVVLIRAIKKFSSYDDDEIVFMPSDVEDFIKESVKGKYINKKPKDILNDGKE